MPCICGGIVFGQQCDVASWKAQAEQSNFDQEKLGREREIERERERM